MMADTTYEHGRRFYADYLAMVNSCAVELPCPLCKDCLLPRDFQTHFQTVHHLHSQYRCLWCARPEYSWEPCKKYQLTLHMKGCFTQLLDSTLKGISTTEAGETTDGRREPLSLTHELQRFQNKVWSRTSPYPCPRRQQNRCCLERVQPRDMERHFRTVHAPFDPSTACVWCDGSFVWPRRQKNRNVEHLSRCFDSYSERVRREENECLLQQQQQQTEPMDDDETAPDDDGSLDSPRSSEPPPPPPTTPAHSSQISCGCPSLKGNMMGRGLLLSDYAYEHLFLQIDFTVFPNHHFFNRIELEEVVERPRCYLDLYCQWNRVREDDDGAYDSADDDEEEDGNNETVATWYHVMVSAFAFDRFVQAVQEFGTDKVFALPFWCWCDGGKPIEPIFRHHRHMILVVRNGCRFVERCWNQFSASERPREDPDICVSEKVERESRVEEDDAISDTYGPPTPLWNADDADVISDPSPPEGFCMGRLTKIRSWLHLAITMKDLSVSQSHCRYDFKGQWVRKRDGATKRPSNNHFCFGEDWHCLGLLSLVCVTSGNGLKGLLDREERLSQLPRLWEARCFSRRPQNGGPWHVRVGDVKDTVRKVLPVKKAWRPTKIISPGEEEPLQANRAFLYLMDMKKLVFERDPSLESLPENEWLRVQADGKNLFYDVVADAHWQVSPCLQKSLDFGEKYALEKVEHAMADKTKEWELERQRERDEDARQWKEKEKVWAAKVKELKNEIESLQAVRGLPSSDEEEENVGEIFLNKCNAENRNHGEGGSLQKCFACGGYGSQVNVNCNVSHVYYQTYQT